MKKVGTVIVDLVDVSRVVDIRQSVRIGMKCTPRGRILSVVFSAPKAWTVSEPLEAIVARIVLGSPSVRASKSEWKFFGNLGVRVCRESTNTRRVDSELMVLMFRLDGPKAFDRQHETSKSLVERSKINVSHPVFTRDVANNVWHLPLNGYKTQLRQRLSMLLSWADESTLLVTPKSQTLFAHCSADLNKALVGVPHKVPYDWYSDNSLLGGI